MANVGNTADKTFVFFTVFNLCGIAFIRYWLVHGFISGCSKYSKVIPAFFGARVNQVFLTWLFLTPLSLRAALRGVAI
jgi:uncharacterized membrane protein